MFDTNSRDNLKKSMRVAAYGHIVSGGNVMRSGYAELVSHFSTIIHNTNGWECGLECIGNYLCYKTHLN